MANGLTRYAWNKLMDAYRRGQALGAPATFYVAIVSAHGADANTPGTELSGGGYTRRPIAASLANFSGTQGAGTTAVSSGTTGAIQSSNNILISFGAGNASAAWTTGIGFELWDVVTGGNRWEFGVLAQPLNVANGNPLPEIPIGALLFTGGNLP